MRNTIYIPGYFWFLLPPSPADKDSNLSYVLKLVLLPWELPSPPPFPRNLFSFLAFHYKVFPGIGIPFSEHSSTWHSFSITKLYVNCSEKSCVNIRPILCTPNAAASLLAVLCPVCTSTNHPPSKGEPKEALGSILSFLSSTLQTRTLPAGASLILAKLAVCPVLQ